MNMKKILKLNLLTLSFVIASSCDSGFDELNTSKTAALSVDPAFILNRATLGAAFPTGTTIYEMGIVQQVISPNSGVLTGANYNQDNRNATVTIWQTFYRGVIKNTKDVIVAAEKDPARANLKNMARILQAYAYMILTDSYGDIPYTEGGAGYTEQIFFPAYESQQSIYPKIIQELTEASDALDAAGKVETADILYAGDIAKWKKFGYSLLLRAGMRLSKANAGLAQSTVSNAFNKGVIVANADNALIRHDANYQNPNGNMLNSTEAANFYLTKPFVDALKNTNDPRLSAIAIRYVGATSGPTQTVASGNTTAAAQIGMPMGKDNATVAAAATADGIGSFYAYSQVDRRRLAKTTSPNFWVTAAQTNLLLAEARFRGWISTGKTAGELFADGVRAHMDQMAAFDAGAAVSAGDRDTYLAANPLVPGTELDQINTQYWIASFWNGPEAFANFRRSGFPALTPNPYPGSEVPGAFINRLTYPNSEISVNAVNVNAAIAAQGADNLATKVWWAK
jgi:Starch-binding associating with outer membrane